jgi:putative tryptophan/tyrosine transport system substrate-binding protein
MRRREFITLLGGMAAAWPVEARSQQGERIRRIGVLTGFAENDPEGRTELSGFTQGFQELGWMDGHHVGSRFRTGKNDPAGVE